ncbi:hypothetical protein SMMN14_03009, partial [Sphaerulina musiva]
MYNAVLIYHIHSLGSIYDDLQALSLTDGCCCRVVDPGYLHTFVLMLNSCCTAPFP